MWNNSGGNSAAKARAKAISEQRERERAKPRLHLDRVKAEVKVTSHLAGPQFADGMVVLNDISPNGVTLMTSAPLMVGDQIALTLEKPKQFFVRGTIVSCIRHTADSKILSQSHYNYRIGIVFNFEAAEERKEVENYCASIQHEHLFRKAC
jgi:hypothetical protein